MTYTFYKYQGTGNDFVILDNRLNTFDKNSTKAIRFLCDRKFGIGADGLILLETHPKYDFKMIYYNADGKESSMCGNGARCLVAFAKALGLVKNKAVFEAIDGVHQAIIASDVIKLQMQDVTAIENQQSHLFLDTGSPHHVQMETELKHIDVKVKGAKIRYSSPYTQVGVNVNFVEKLDNTTFSVRTYERGVENETLSCGTGVTAVALAMHHSKQTQSELITLATVGGELQVSFKFNNGNYTDIWLIGPAVCVFKGKVQCEV